MLPGVASAVSFRNASAVSFRNAVSGEFIVLVVSPLKALMVDLVDICCVKGLKSVCVCGDEKSRRVYNSVVIIKWFLSVQRC